ncbi:unnamed protein product, partial [Phaeothamnion confervicola]
AGGCAPSGCGWGPRAWTPRRAARRPAPTTPDPIEIAMQAEADGAAPSGVAARVLEKQERLIGWQIAKERAGFGLRILAGLAGLAAAAALGLMVWNASRADGLVVEAFLVPPDLAAQGITGEVVARAVLDRVAELDRNTNSLFATQVSDAWTRNTKIEVAQTGVSLDEVDRLLRRWLGHETYLSGEVVRTPLPAASRPGAPLASQATPSGGGMGIRIIARSAAGSPAVAEGSADDMPALFATLAEQVYARTRPLSYAEFLVRADRLAEARKVLDAVLESTDDPMQRSLAYDIMGLTLGREGRPREAILFFAATMRSPDPTLASVGACNAANSHRILGHATLERDFLEACGRLARRGRKDRGPQAQARVLMGRYDYLAAERVLRPIAGRRLPGTGSTNSPWAVYAANLANLHQVTAAERLAPGRAPPQLIANDMWREALASSDRAEPRTALQPAPRATRAMALVRVGRLDEAKPIVAALPADCDICFVARGYVAGAAGDAAGANRAFAEARRLAPADAGLRVLIGRDRLLRGDARAAAADFAAAAKLAPRWADPIAYWGETLLAQGDAAGAAAKFAKAEPLAPKWGRLHLKWGEPLAKLGKRDEAQAQFRLAATLDLTADERAELARLSGTAA